MIWAVLSLALGGILKGATGAGAPVVAIPVLALFYGVEFAVTTLMVSNLVSNIVQGWAYRADVLPARFTARFALAGLLGAALGTWALARLPAEALELAVAGMVVLYIAFRVARPGWRLGMGWGERLAAPAGLMGGVMQGAAGISAPISLTFLNALGLERRVFVGTISVFFVAMSLSQIPALVGLGIMTWERFWISCGAFVVILGFMPVGNWLGKRVSKDTFDRLTLVLLAAIAAKIIHGALAG
ncbi:MAG: sulfite exporter TauE/SafE family protein [Alphaproteobacteria bacterium HGW-Alphaproteobacteria-2]|nr:MAG: sulfite exporter TauE/SafE family protein [Alphaproteobacteria bacterium HGW-Alphaproteobacteria-2]